MRLLSPNAALVLHAFLSNPTAPLYGYEIMQDTGIKSGTLYPILGRFEKLGWIVGRMEASESGRPPRRVYEVHPPLVSQAREALDRFHEETQVSADQLGWSM